MTAQPLDSASRTRLVRKGFGITSATSMDGFSELMSSDNLASTSGYRPTEVALTTTSAADGTAYAPCQATYSADAGVLSTEINHAVGEDAVLVHHVFTDPDALVHYFSTTASQHIAAERARKRSRSRLNEGIGGRASDLKYDGRINDQRGLVGQGLSSLKVRRPTPFSSRGR